MRPKKLSAVFFTIAFLALAFGVVSLTSIWSTLGPQIVETDLARGMRTFAFIVAFVFGPFGVLLRFAEGTHGSTELNDTGEVQ